ncbi:MAG: hypothetical protein IT435_17740 [Phycisphaerales bacterium]|nr:hypothetical protein [Phycisphaerales bacterium]
MILADIKERLAKEPFEPFQIRSSSGQTYPVTTPFQVALMKSKIFIAEDKSDRWAELSYLHIAALESLSNGHARRVRRRGGRR